MGYRRREELPWRIYGERLKDGLPLTAQLGIQ